jgi:hypothetical protein
MDNMDKTDKKIFFYNKDAAEWRAFRPKLLAMAGGKNCRRAMIKNKSDKDVDKDATKEELTAAYEFIMLTVRDDKLISTLDGLYTDEDAEQYDGHKAFKHIDNLHLTVNSIDKAKDKKNEYDNIRAERLEGFPSRNDVTTRFDKMFGILQGLKHTPREISVIELCLDMKASFLGCGEGVMREVDKAWGSLAITTRFDKMFGILQGLKHTPREISVIELCLDMKMKASFLGCGDGVMREVDKAWGSLTIQQREMSDAVHTALVEAAAIAYKHESIRSAICPGQRALQVNKSETESDAAKMAYEAGYRAGRGGGRGGGGRGMRGRGNVDPCNHCGRNHIGTCWSNPDTAHLIEWDKVPEHLHAKIRSTLYDEEPKKKRSADKKPGGGRLTFACNKVDQFDNTGEDVNVSEITKYAGTASKTMRILIDSGATGANYFNSLDFFPDGIDKSRTDVIDVTSGKAVRSWGTGTAKFLALVCPHQDAQPVWQLIEKPDASYGPFKRNMLSTHKACTRQPGLLAVHGAKNGFIMPNDGAYIPFTVGNDAEGFYLDVKSANDPEYKAYGLGPCTTDKHKDMHATRDEAKEIWRMRLGHPTDERLRKMPEYCVDVPTSLKQLPARKADDVNEVARISNSQWRADGGKHGPWRTTTVGEVMANDILEMPVRSVLTSYKYVDVFYDVHSGLVFAYPMRFKSEHPTMLRRFLADTRDFFTTKRLHSDNGPVLVSDDITKICDESLIRKQESNPYEPWGNPAEMGVKLLERTMRPLLIGCGAPDEYWEFALYPAMLIINRIPRSDGSPPPLVRSGIRHTIDLSMLNVFGCKAIVQKPKAYRENKLSAQADECIYPPGTSSCPSPWARSSRAAFTPRSLRPSSRGRTPRGDASDSKTTRPMASSTASCTRSIPLATVTLQATRGKILQLRLVLPPLPPELAPPLGRPPPPRPLALPQRPLQPP